MSVQIVRVSGDYQVQTKNGGILLDALNDGFVGNRSANPGAVTVYGNLDVLGNTTYIESTNTNIVDNVLFLNAGETNGYVSAGTAGIAISRGSTTTYADAATLFYNDGNHWSYNNIVDNQGVWEFGRGDGVAVVPSAISVNAIRVGASQNFLNLFGKENPTAVLNVRGTTDYETRLLDDDDIPNKKYVDDRTYLGEEFAKKVRVGNSFIEINDSSVDPTDKYYKAPSRIFAALNTSSNVVFKLENLTALIQGLTVSDTNISVNSGRLSNSMRLTAIGTGTVEISTGLSLSNIPTPGPKNNFTTVYSTSTIGGGGTGLYFVNTERRDELVSKKRAIIYGIIF